MECENSSVFDDFGVKIIAPACSTSIFTPRGCVSIKILTFFTSAFGVTLSEPPPPRSYSSALVYGSKYLYYRKVKIVNEAEKFACEFLCKKIQFLCKHLTDLVYSDLIVGSGSDVRSSFSPGSDVRSR